MTKDFSLCSLTVMHIMDSISVPYGWLDIKAGGVSPFIRRCKAESVVFIDHSNKALKKPRGSRN